MGVNIDHNFYFSVTGSNTENNVNRPILLTLAKFDLPKQHVIKAISIKNARTGTKKYRTDTLIIVADRLISVISGVTVEVVVLDTVLVLVVVVLVLVVLVVEVDVVVVVKNCLSGSRML